MASLKYNILYKGLLTISNFLISFVTFPYVTRVLGVDCFGKVNFALNVVDFFLLFATMGVSIIGTREIAAVKNNARECDRVFSSILGMNVVFTVVVTIVFVIAIQIIPRFSQDKSLLYVGIAKILSTCFLIEWFYTGIEKFKYITIRSLIVRGAYVLIVFLLIRTSSDYKLYFVLTIAVVLINAVINFGFSGHIVTIVPSELWNFTFLRQNVILGIYSIMGSTYLTFNVMWLGLVSNDVQVGYYTTAFRLYGVAITMFGAFTAVMMPRMSALLANNYAAEFKRLLHKSLRMCLSYSIPIVTLGITFAPHIVKIVAGNGYDGAIFPMRIIMPAVFAVCLAQVIALQIIVPLKNDRILLIASIVGATVAITLNLAIVRNLGALGSALTLVLSEFSVTMVYIIHWKRKCKSIIPANDDLTT